MPWSGGVYTATNGVFTGTGIWAKDAAAGTKITAAHHDTHDDDLAAGINACAAKDGSNTVTFLNLSGTVNSSSGIIKVGSLVLASTYGTNNAFFGGAGNFTTTGTNNVGTGSTALLALTTGSTNTADGYGALTAATTGSENVAVGDDAASASTTASGNTAIGTSALSSATTGGHNTAVGYFADVSTTTGTYNVVIGAQCNTVTAGNSGQLNLQNALYGTGNTATGTTVSSGNLGVYTKAPTARLHLPAGTATANTAPLKLTAGTNLGTPENGALEYDGTHLYFTTGGVRTQIV